MKHIDLRNARSLFALVVLLLAIPLTVFLSQKQQEIRQRAVGEQTAVYFATSSSTTPQSEVTIAPSGQQTLRLFLDSRGMNVSGFDVTVHFGSNVDLVLGDVVEGADAARFSTPVFKTINSTNRTFRFSKVTTDTTANIVGLLHLATITFTATGVQGATGTLTFPSATITSPSSPDALTVEKMNVNYTISTSATPTPPGAPTATPTNVPTPTPTTPAIAQTAVYFATTSTTTPVTQTTVPASSQGTLRLFLDTRGMNVSGFDVTINYGTNLSLTSSGVVESADASRFSTPVFNTVNDTNKTFRFSKVTTDTTANITGVLHLATITFTATGVQGATGTLTFPSATITSPSSLDALTVEKTNVSYTIGTSQTTPTPTRVPTPTIGPTATPIPPPSYSQSSYYSQGGYGGGYSQGGYGGYSQGSYGAQQTGSGLRATYFDNSNFTGLSITRVDPFIYFNWGVGQPHPSIQKDTFSVRWEGSLLAPHTGTYTFYARTDDGVRVWVNNRLLINRLAGRGLAEVRGSIALVGGQRYPIKVEYIEHSLRALAQLFYSATAEQITVSKTKQGKLTQRVTRTVILQKQIIPHTQLFP